MTPAPKNLNAFIQAMMREVSGSTEWKRAARYRIARMTPAQAATTLHSMRDRGCTIEHPEVREITGGFSSQAIVYEVTRMLGVRAGLIKGD